MTSPQPRLRPLSAGDILDQAIQIYRRNFGTFIAIAAITLVPALMWVFFIPAMPTMDPMMEPTMDEIFAIAGPALVLGIISGLVSLIAVGGLIYATSQAIMGHTTTAGEAYRVGIRKLLPIFGLGIVYGLAVGLLFITILGIPFAIYLAVAWALSYHALVLENTGIFRSLGRSRQLVRGTWWRVLGILLLVLILSWFISIIAAIPGSALAGMAGMYEPGDPLFIVLLATGTLLSSLGSVLVLPFIYGAITSLYYDLRVRKEGYDLEVMSDQGARPQLPGHPY